MTQFDTAQAPFARDGLPEAAAMIARLAILDTCAVIEAGHRAQPVEAVQRMISASGSAGAGAVALRLGTAAHALDFDDYEDVGSTHPSACIVPTLLALTAEARFSLRAVLEAYVAGYEVILAFGRALGHAHYLRGWHATATIGRLGAAAAAAHLLGLTAAGAATAISLAATDASGLKRQFGSDAKAFHCGLAARTGIEAALLAKAGMTARLDILEGPDGFLSLYSAASRTWPAEDPFRIEDHRPWIKPWPSCAYTHRAIEAARHLAETPDFDAACIARAELQIAEPYLAVAGFRAPQSEAEARFSATYCVAATLIDANVDPETFTTRAIQRPEIRALEAKIETQAYALPPGAGDMSPAASDRLTLSLKDGRILSKTVAETPGSPARPLSPEALLATFAACGGDPETGRGFLAAPLSYPFTPPSKVT